MEEPKVWMVGEGWQSSSQAEGCARIQTSNKTMTLDACGFGVGEILIKEQQTLKSAIFSKYSFQLYYICIIYARRISFQRKI